MASTDRSPSLRSMYQHNLQTFRRQPLAEISGSLGDLGTFLPLLVAETKLHQISLPTTLILTGIYNILTGCFFGIPLPVQPMKAIAAVAILRGLSAGEVEAAGLFVSICIFIFSVTGLLRWFTDAIPVPVVKGIQVGAGLSLVISAGSSILSQLCWIDSSWADNYIWAIVAFLALMALNSYPRIPYALIVFIIGILFALILTFAYSHGRHFQFGFWHPYTQIPTGGEWKDGIIVAGIGQLPLTTLNSVVAVVHLAADLLPDVTTPSTTAIGLSVSAMNIVGCWFGAMPVCHGSGGLAAQHKFGARSGASIIFLGVLKLLIGSLFGESLALLLRRFPVALLSVLVIAAGLELASVGESLNTERARDLGKSQGLPPSTTTTQIDEAERKRRWSTMLVTVGGILAFRNDAIGFIAGMVCYWSYKLPSLLYRHRIMLQEANLSPSDARSGEGLLQDHD
ncbi:MAG: hypothetical protein Q9227_001366 [Pyrenula ochraceoflavens]